MAAKSLGRQAWLEQKYRAKNRGIEFLFTYEEWLAWWVNALSERGPEWERGRGAGKLSMCRRGDVGPYAPYNVYAGTAAENLADIPPEVKAAAVLKTKRKLTGNGCWLAGITGADHPRSRGIKTKDGYFPSITAASDHYGVSRTEIRRRLEDGRL